MVKKKIAIFYKSLIDPGGAERLLVKLYEELTLLGYNVNIVSFNISSEALFDVNISDDHLIDLNSRFYALRFFKLLSYMIKNKKSLFICDSGHIDFYLSSVLANIDYSMHLHHPLFMSFNDFDKYSIFLSKYFKKRINSNYGAERFLKIKNELSFFQIITLNIRAFVSILAFKKSKNNFVLSSYAKDEKKELFGIDSSVICGALDKNIFQYEAAEIESKYDDFESIIFTVGRLDINKRISDLIKAFDVILSSGKNYALLIGGKGPEYFNLQSLVKDIGIENNVFFLGFVPEKKLFNYYAKADLFISIDWADYRITSYEALAMGTKVILSNETEADPFLINSRFLYIVEPSIVNTVKCIELALSESPKISIDSLHSYLKKFSWEVYSKLIINKIEKSV